MTKEYKPPSEAQHRARMRNWGIRNLRALYRLAHQLSRERCEAVQVIIDEELKERGAKTQVEIELQKYHRSINKLIGQE